MLAGVEEVNSLTARPALGMLSSAFVNWIPAHQSLTPFENCCCHEDLAKILIPYNRSAQLKVCVGHLVIHCECHYKQWDEHLASSFFAILDCPPAMLSNVIVLDNAQTPPN